MYIRLKREELPPDAPALARFLIGNLIVHEVSGGPIVGRIVETEAYLADDPASHSFRGRTKRNGAMFLTAGHAYCYLSYGCWTALNVSSGPAGLGEAVLLRAVEIVRGGEAIPVIPRLHRSKLASGPGRLTRALGVGLQHNGIDLCSDEPLFLARSDVSAGEIGTSPRIGITKAADWPLRFFERGSAALSGTRRLNGLEKAVYES